jgi:membrane protein implicated in regulation of membrane protease activity
MMWWGWMVLGALLLSAELFAVDAQFYLVFLGVSAALVGVLALAGIELPEWGQWALFAVLALISFVTFRKSLYEKLRGGAAGFRESLAGEEITVPAYLPVGGEGRIELNGSQWTARNVGDQPIEAGRKANVVAVDGVTLRVKGA